MANVPFCSPCMPGARGLPAVPITAFSFSLLISSPVKVNVYFCPISSFTVPLGALEMPYSSLVISGLDIFIKFLMKRSLVQAPIEHQIPNQNFPITLTLDQLAQIMQEAANGNFVIPNANRGGIQYRATEPLQAEDAFYPDVLSFSLAVSAPSALNYSSPVISYRVPLFDVPGAPGNLIIALGSIISQFYIERSGFKTWGNGQ